MNNNKTSLTSPHQTAQEVFLSTFPTLNNKTVQQLAAMFHQAERTGDGILITRILHEVKSRERCFDFSYLKSFIKNYWEL